MNVGSASACRSSALDLAFGYYHLPVQTPANYELVSTSPTLTLRTHSHVHARLRANRAVDAGVDYSCLPCATSVIIRAPS